MVQKGQIEKEWKEFRNKFIESLENQDKIQKEQIKILKKQEEFNISIIIAYSLLVILGGIGIAINYFIEKISLLIFLVLIGGIIGFAIGMLKVHIKKMIKLKKEVRLRRDG